MAEDYQEIIDEILYLHRTSGCERRRNAALFVDAFGNGKFGTKRSETRLHAEFRLFP